MHSIEQVLRGSWKVFLRRQQRTPVYWTITLVTVYWLSIVLLERIFYFPWPVKVVFLTGMIVLAVFIFTRLRKDRKQVTFISYYRGLADQHNWPELKNLMDLSLSTEDSLFRIAAIEQNLESIRIGYLEKVLSGQSRSREHKFYRLGVRMASLTLLLLAGSVIITPAPHERMLRFWTSFLPPNPYVYTVSPGNRIVNQDDSVRVILKVRSNNLPGLVRLEIKTGRENQFRIQPMTLQRDDVYISKPFVPVTGIIYRVRMDRYYSRRYRIGVELRPRFRSLRAVIRPPAYTGLDTSIIRYPFASLNAYPGSEIDITGVLNKPVSRLRMIRHMRHDTIPIVPVEGQKYINMMHLKLVQGRRDSCSFMMVDSAGLTNGNSFAFVMNPIQDNPPLVHLIKPAADLSMLRPDTLSVSYALNDDYGFHGVALRYRIKKSFVGKPISGVVRLKASLKPKSIQTYRWDLTKLGLDPLDQLQFWIEARDNDRYAGYQKGESGKRLIRMESMAETINETNQKENDISGMLDSLKQNSEQTSGEMDNITRQVASGRRNDLSTRQQFDRVKSSQKKQDAIAGRLSAQVDSLRNRLKKDNLVSKQTLQKYDELKRLIDQIKDPALRKAIEELQKSLSQNQSALTSALQNYRFNEQLYRQKLQRTIDLFKMLKLTMRLDKMEKATRELEKREHELTGEQKSSGSLKKQKEIQDELNRLFAHSDSLRTQSPDQLKPIMGNLADTLRAQSGNANKLLQSNIGQLSHAEPDMADIHKQQQKISNRLEGIAKTISEVRRRMNRKQARLNLTALKNIMQDILLLSDVQESITKDLGQLKRGADVFIDRARDEHNIRQGFNNVSDSLRQLASQIPVLSESVTQKKEEISDQLNRAMDALSNRDPVASKATTTRVLSGLNELGSMVSSLIEQLSNSPSGMGGGGMMSYSQMLKKMQQLSAGQRGLNGQIQDLLNDLQGNRLSESQVQRFKQLADQQEMIRRQIRQLQRSGAFQPGDKAISDLQRVQDQMNDAVNDLRGASDNQLFMNRQQNILSRMLTAEHAIQKRGMSKKRQSETAGNVKSKPPAMTMSQLKEALDKQMESTRELPFSPEYRQLIERYFNLLKQQLAGEGSE